MGELIAIEDEGAQRHQIDPKRPHQGMIAAPVSADVIHYPGCPQITLTSATRLSGLLGECINIALLSAARAGYHNEVSNVADAWFSSSS